MLKDSRRREGLLRRDIAGHDLVEAGIRLDQRLDRGSRGDQVSEADIFRARGRKQGILEHVHGRRCMVGDDLGVAALDFADDVGDSVGNVVAAGREVEQEGADLVDQGVGGVVVA